MQSMATEALEWGPGISVLASSPKDSDAQICRGSDPNAREQRKEGWERSEEEHLEPPPADLTLSASGQAAYAKETKAKSEAGLQERELLPVPGCGCRGSCLQLPASERRGTTRTSPSHCLPNIKNDKTPYFSSM